MSTILFARGVARTASGTDRDDARARPRDGGFVPAPVEGDPVLLVGGFGTTAPVLGPMARRLATLGYDVTPAAVGVGMDCAQRSVDVLTARVHELAERTGRPVRLLGHSRGGQFARAAGVQAPRRQVAGLVTVGTPFDLYGLSLPTLAVAAAVTVAGTAGLPHLARLHCLFGACCRRFRAQLRHPWPDRTPFTSIFSPSDRVVPARASIDPSARNVEVSAGHLGLLTERGAHRAVAEALARRPGDAVPAAA